MVYHFLGETEVKLGGRRCRLRPSFAALYTIEHHVGQPLSLIIERLGHQACTPALLHTIFKAGLDAAGEDSASLLRWCSPERLDLIESAAAFLLRGLGYPLAQEEAALECAKHDTIEDVEWESAYQLATGVLGQSEQAFWQMTLNGLTLTAEAHAERHGIHAATTPGTAENGPAPAATYAPLTRSELTHLQHSMEHASAAASLRA